MHITVLAGVVVFSVALAGAAWAQGPDPFAQHLVLVGVVLGRPDGPMAVVKDRRTGKEALYHVGDRIEDATLLTVTADRAVVRAGGRSVELRLAASGRHDVPAVRTPPRRIVPPRLPARPPRFPPRPRFGR
jgi:hypothetical protein